MAQYFKFQFMGRNFEARCTSRDTRNGFAHDCTVHDDNYNDCATAHCYYLNRTWERFTYESVLHEAIYQMAQEKADRLVERWKEENGKSRISKEKREELTAPVWEAKKAAYDTIVRL